ncbi:MAG TPA: hypothetical protein VN872_06585, partial [Candidatus Acidoferrum sp.]|nr:hypothetical protein [Candidatus Acidoferrum sp.]
MTSEETRFFVLVSDFAQRNHQCKLTEFFQSADGNEYVLCFRPLAVDATGQRYIYLPASDVEIVSSLNSLPVSIVECLHYELRNLGGNFSTAFAAGAD